MFSLLGGPALSQFRLDKLLAQLQALDPRVRAISSRFIHFVADATSPNDSRDGPAQAAVAVWAELDRAGRPGVAAAHEADRDAARRHGLALVEQGTDIAQVCGLGFVQRLERGTVYFLEAAAPLGSADLHRSGRCCTIA
jgi:phosphoribosylformylglycinamidine synthase